MMEDYQIYFVLILVIFGGLISAFYYAQGLDGTVSISAIVEEFVIQETTSGVVKPTEGGEVELATETGATASVFFPSGAVATSTNVSISSVSEADIVSTAPIPSNLNVVGGLVYNFRATADGETLTIFEQPVTLTFTYTNAQISGLDESTVRVYYWNGTAWILLSDYTLNTANNTISVNTTHFTLFAIMASEPSPPSTGGGGGAALLPTVTKVVLKGKAYPLSSVTVLQDGKVATTVVADPQANFNVEITKITPGTWTFGVWAEDKEDRKSITFSFTVSVSSGMTTTISGIFLPPTIDLDKTVLQRGETLNMLGQTAPKSDVSVFVNSPEEIVRKTKAETDGTWFYGFDTTPLDEGSHSTRAKATSPEGLLSTFSQTLAFSIGKEIVRIIEKADVNNDGKVNLVDFSILLYNWGIPKDPSTDFNNDGKVNLVDFSIMLYYWTG